MKIYIIYLSLLFVALFCNLGDVFSQATSSDPTRVLTGGSNTPSTLGGDFLGWATGVGLPLNIGNYDPQKINFFTNGNPSGQIDPTSTANTSIGYLTPLCSICQCCTLKTLDS